MVLSVLEALAALRIYPRRYFYPSVNTLSHIMSYEPCPISEDLAQRILCLPLYYQLQDAEIDTICSVIEERMRPQ